MLTPTNIIEALKNKRGRPDAEQLRQLPDRKAVVHGRLSGFSQVKDSAESVREIAMLVDIAKQDGYQTNLDSASVERWLAEIQSGVTQPGILEDGEIIVNCLGLGISGSLPEEKRPDLTLDTDLLRKHSLGAIYVTEGANRLSRDPDRVVSSMLLKLMKESNCKLRTSREILSPCIERDWEIIHEEFEKGAEELKEMHKRLHRRKELKAARGEFIGEPIPPGFYLPIQSQKSNGEYLYDKMKKYPPHAEVDEKILTGFIRSKGSYRKTAESLSGITFPFFPPELAYMSRLSSLRMAAKGPSGYIISGRVVKGIVTNPKLIGIWLWGGCKAIMDNHELAAPKELFLEAYELAMSKDKPRGRAAGREPLEWAGLLRCLNHDIPHLISYNASEKVYHCQNEYNYGRGSVCLHTPSRFIDEPLTNLVLGRLDLAVLAEELLARIEGENFR